MLSYRHAYHAGNFADVIKHLVLVEVLEHFIRKDKPFTYIDTHAGAGLYSLKTEQAGKTLEYQQGIGRLFLADIPPLAHYQSMIRSFNPTGVLDVYPGSPLIARQLLRPQDQGWLFELHPADYDLLCRNLAGQRQLHVRKADGLKSLNALLPPPSRRGLVLIDPSYEIKTDYDTVVRAQMTAYRKFSTGTYALWYPVVQRRLIDRMESALISSGIRNIQLFELAVAPDTTDHGMTAAGMIVINPPWTLMQHMQVILPLLARHLGSGQASQTRCLTLVEE